MTTDRHPTERPRTALVLGAGGTVGIAYHAGVLRALDDWGFDPAKVDLMVGTSAGAIVGSILRAGCDLDEVWQLAHDDVNPFVENEPFFRRDVVFSQGWKTPIGLARRLVGSSYVVQRTVLPWPTMAPPTAMSHFYRAGLASVTEQRDEFVRWTGEDWPDKALRLCAFDIVTGRRFVLGEPGNRLPLPDAMRASSAVPVLYPPVRRGRRLLVDGGLHSSTNLDVAVEAGARRIIVAAPMALDRSDPPPMRLRAHREYFVRKMECEIRKAREAGAEVLVLAPSSAESEVHGYNLLRAGGNSQVADMARQRTSEILDSASSRSFLKRWA